MCFTCRGRNKNYVADSATKMRKTHTLDCIEVKAGEETETEGGLEKQ